jgi:tRNA (guanine-N7-)-methyltransferase
MSVACASGPLLDLAAVSLPLRAADVFGWTCPVELEIGIGKGRFLIAWAAARPEMGLLGVERARKYVSLTALRVARLGLGNVRVVHTTAEDLLFRCLASGSVDGIHIYFSDPWPKKRHHKRRLFRPDTVRRMAEVMRAPGLLRAKTDHDGYAEVIAATLQAEPLLEEIDAEVAFVGLPETSFEIRYAGENRHFHRFAYRRRELAR